MAEHAYASGSVFLVERVRGPAWYAKYRVSDPGRPGGVRQVQRRLGPAWTKRSRPPFGFLNRKGAQGRLEAILTDARRQAERSLELGVSFADAAREWLRHGEQERQLKRSTLRDYRSAVERHLIPAFGTTDVSELTTANIEDWLSSYVAQEHRPRQAQKLLAITHGVLERSARAWNVPADNPASDVEKPRVAYDRTAFEFYSPEEIWALVRAADSDVDGALFATAAFAGLRRGECLALRWRDVDFPREAIRVQRSAYGSTITSPKSGHGRVVPLAPELSTLLARLARRDLFNSPNDLLFCSATGNVLDGSALRRRFKRAIIRAELQDLRFHDLRHTFGSLAIQEASIVQVQNWLGHADVKTTARYLHYKNRRDEAAVLARAFSLRSAAADQAAARS